MKNLLVIENSADSLSHGVQPEGYECHQRLEQALEGIKDAVEQCHSIVEYTEATQSTEKNLLLVHSPSYIAELEAASLKSELTNPSPFGDECLLYPESLNAAKTAVGGAIEGIDRLAKKEFASVFVAARSPGHHAEPDRAMGYCLLSTAAIAARYAQSKYGLKVSVLDLDAHSGNGTIRALNGLDGFQFLEAYIEGCPENSYPYPSEARISPATNIVTVGLPVGTHGRVWREAISTCLLPYAETFKPDLLIISFGVDCMAGDPIGGFGATEEDILEVTRAARRLGVPILSILEGGYDLDNLRSGTKAHLLGLLAS